MTDLEDYRSTARAWLEANVPRRAPGTELRTAHAEDPEQLAAERRLQAAVYEAGYFGITVPTEYGGQGLTVAHERVWREESAGFAVPAPGGVASHVTLGIVLPTLLGYASEEQKRSWVPRMLSGQDLWVQLLSEPGAGSDLAGVLTRADRDGDEWVLSGTKVWSSGAMSADYGICLARTDWDVPKHRGLTWFRVPLHDPAVTVRPIREINGGAEFCEEFLDGVRVGDDARIGDLNGGWPIANAMLMFERAAVGTNAGGGGRRQRRLAPDLVELATARGLADDPATRQQIARAHINDWVQAQLTARITEAVGTGAAKPTTASYIKLSLGIIQPIRAAIAMEIGGRSAVAWADESDPGHGAAINFLNGRIMSIAGGSNQIQRNIIAEQVLGLPREPVANPDQSFRDVLREARTWGGGPR